MSEIQKVIVSAVAGAAVVLVLIAWGADVADNVAVRRHAAIARSMGHEDVAKAIEAIR